VGRRGVGGQWVLSTSTCHKKLPQRRFAKTSAFAVAMLFAACLHTARLPSAEATCHYSVGPLTVHSVYFGTTVATESVWYSGTCDWDNFYAGGIYDPVTDGSCAYVWYYDSGYSATQGYSCTTNGRSYYSYTDVNSNYYVNFDLGTTYHYDCYYTNEGF
jgi:hypothetical protein